MVTKAMATFASAFAWNGTEVGRLSNVGDVPQELEIKTYLLHDSTSGWPEAVPTTFKSGVIKLKGIYDPSDTGQAAMATDFAAKTQRAWVRYSADDSWTWSGNGYISKYEPKGDGVADIDEIEIEVTIDGVPTLSYEASTGLTTPFFTVTGSAGASTITPAAAQASYSYNVTLAAGSTSYYVTPTATAGTITVVDNSGNTQTVLTGANSTSITAPTNSMHTIYIKVKESGKVAKVYKLNIGEPV